MNKTYTPTIGLEVHAELATASKMFCSCKNEPHGAVANTHVCPVCTGQPGTLPVPNKEAVRMVLQFGIAVDADQADYSEFDRKNYFYPDIPKAYQISQYKYPFLLNGELHGVSLTRVHLEEDTARSIHDQGEGSLVDFNRAGVPLMELVTEPVLHDAKTAGDFARELQLLLKTLGISEANMERGEMRIEANVSVSCDKTLGTKVEVKNINSFKAVEAAIEYEIMRQSELLDTGVSVVQETRGWDENRNKTVSQRSKETAKDYRYFPDPDIPKLQVTQYSAFSPEKLSENMSLLPNKKRDLYEISGISPQLVEVLIADRELDALFSGIVFQEKHSSGVKQLAANYIAVDLVSLRSNGLDVTLIPVTLFVELMGMLAKGEIGSKVAKVLLPQLHELTGTVREFAAAEGLLQVSDAAALQSLVNQVIESNPDQAAEYRAGKESLLKFFVGQGMKESKGSANPSVLETLFKEKLDA